MNAGIATSLEPMSLTFSQVSRANEPADTVPLRAWAKGRLGIQILPPATSSVSSYHVATDPKRPPLPGRIFITLRNHLPRPASWLTYSSTFVKKRWS